MGRVFGGLVMSGGRVEIRARLDRVMVTEMGLDCQREQDLGKDYSI